MIDLMLLSATRLQFDQCTYSCAVRNLCGHARPRDLAAHVLLSLCEQAFAPMLGDSDKQCHGAAQLL